MRIVTSYFRKPEVIPSLFLVGALIVLCGLGAWQVQRLQWKNNLINGIEIAQAQPPLVWLPVPKDKETYNSFEFRWVKGISGKFLHDKELHLVGQYMGKGGYHILTPFQPTMHLKAKADQVTILVDRGWIPAEMKNERSRLALLEEKQAKIDGVLLMPKEKRPFSPPNNILGNLWFFQDIQAMSQHIGGALFPMILVEVRERKAGVYPIPSDGKMMLHNDHLGYAITWFSLALAAVVMFGIYYRKKPGDV